MSLAPQTRLGPYEIIGPIGAGGMGEVYKARDTRLDRTVAVKVSNGEFSERFEREARAAAALNHPNICQIYDVGPNYIVMEFIDGAPLGNVEGPRQLLDLAVQMADGMAAAHAAGFVHRDLKPDNILVTRDGRVKILDFGLAKQAMKAAAAESSQTITTTNPGTVLGTVAYMSPEQARGRDVDARSDQFSFGLVLYELAAGKRAFDRETSAEVMAAILREEPPPLPGTVPAPLRWTIDRCLAKDPGERYDSTRDLYRELRQIRQRLSEATTAAHSAATAEPAPRKRWWWPWAAAVTGVAVVAIAAVMLRSEAPPLPTLTPFAAEAEIQTAPAWSPKGDRIAYVAPVNGVFQVFTRALTSSARAQLTHQNVSCWLPFWSADGLRVYYVAGRQNTLLDGELWSAAVAGGAPVKVLNNVSYATMSPDGKTIAMWVRINKGQVRLGLSSPPGAPPKFYERTPFEQPTSTSDFSFLKYSRDGRTLGVSQIWRGNWVLWKVPMPDGTPQSVGAGVGTDPFDWMPGNREVISAGLTLWDVISGNARRISNSLGEEAAPAISPDALTIAYSSGDAGFDIVEVPLDGSGVREVIATARSEVAPAWSPDGLRFAYATNRSGEFEIWLHNVQDDSESRIAVPHIAKRTEDQGVLDCAFSPDGSRIAYRVGAPDATEIWISLLSGEAPVKLWEDPERRWQKGATWSPDGNWIAFYSTYQGKPSVMKVRVGSGQPPELVTSTSEPQPVRWSPKGDWIAVHDLQTLRLVSPDGKQEKVVSQKKWETYGWSADGESLLGIAIHDRHLTLARIEVKTGAETHVADLGPVTASMEFANFVGEFAFRGFAMHPNGKSFLTSVYRARTQIYLMRNWEGLWRR